MFIDSRHADAAGPVVTDVCIIGGGVAGITIALELQAQGLGICLLESGGFAADTDTMDLNRGESIGLPYHFADGCRSRFLGGSSNCWGGWCRPLEELDFERREWVPNSGWPFSKSELRSYYDRSHDLLKLGPRRYDTDYWVKQICNADVRRLPLEGSGVIDGISQFSPPARFGKLYRGELAASQHVRVYLHANVVEIETDGAQTVRRVHVKTLTGRQTTVSAKVFILATGGIENARLLLASNRQRPGGLGNQYDLVGRYFMDHPRLYTGKIRFTDAWRRNILYDEKFNYQNKAVSALGTCVAAQFGLSPQVQAAERLLNARVSLSSVFAGAASEAAEALGRIRKRIRRHRLPGGTLPGDILTMAKQPLSTAEVLLARYLPVRSLVSNVQFQVIIEPPIDPQSRVTLSPERDSLGLNRVCVDWRLDSLAKRTVDRTVAMIAEAMIKCGVANVDLDPSIESNGWPSTFAKEGCWHHMGTTRMHDSPRLGVVDRYCRVHGINNLYVAGSSVFPTGGGNFPTITIVALALRLSQHIAVELSSPVYGLSRTA